MTSGFWRGVFVTVVAGACAAAFARAYATVRELSDEPVPYWPAEALDALATAVQCIACAAVRELGDLAFVVECTCTAGCGADGCQGGKLPLRQTSATWNDDDMDILDGKRLP